MLTFEAKMILSQCSREAPNKCSSIFLKGEVWFKVHYLETKHKIQLRLVCINHKTKKGIVRRAHVIILIADSMPVFELIVGPSRTQLQGHLTDVHHERRSKRGFFILLQRTHCCNTNAFPNKWKSVFKHLSMPKKIKVSWSRSHCSSPFVTRTSLLKKADFFLRAQINIT